MFQEPNNHGEDRFQPENRDFNFGIIPDFVPDNLLELETPAQALHKAFGQLAEIRGATDLEPHNELGNSIAQALTESVASRLQAYCAQAEDCGLIMEVQDVKVADGNHVMMMIDISDRFFGVLASVRDVSTAPAKGAYEKFENPVRLFVGAMPIEQDDKQGTALCTVINAPMFSPAAYAELVKHLDETGCAAKEMGQFDDWQKIPAASMLLDRMLTKIDGTLMQKSREGGDRFTYELSQIHDVKILDAHNFDITVGIRANSNEEKNGFNPIVSRTYSFYATTNEHGFLVVDWRNRESKSGMDDPIDRRQAA